MDTLTHPTVKALDYIFIGKKRGTHAVVAEVQGHRVRVVYACPQSRAMVEWAVWRDGYWAFEQTGPCSTYADLDHRLLETVAKLRGEKQG